MRVVNPRWEGFVAEPVDDRYAITWAAQGVGGSGKTHFLLTAPEPVAVMLLNDIDGVRALRRQPAFKTRDIRVKHYNFQPAHYATGADRQKAADDLLDEFIADYYVALKHARTIGWDKEDQVWELMRYARLGNVSGKPAKYYDLNIEYRNWVNDAQLAGVNLGLLRGMKEKWGTNDSGTPIGLGTDIPRGHREIDEMVQVYLQHRWDADERKFVVQIGPPGFEKCRVGPAEQLLGLEFPNLDFLALAVALYPDTDPAVWGV